MSDSEDDAIEKQLKIVFLGDANVGKTSIVRRFCQDEFTRQCNPTAGADFYTKHLVFPGRQDITLMISDVGGSELNGNMLDKYLYNTNLIILVYDVTNASSFDNLSTWIDTVSKLIVMPTLTAVFGNKFIEKYTENIRFCIICNYLSKIIPALQSRCTRFRFAPLSPEQIMPRLNHVIDEENLIVTKDGKEALLALANGDMRKVLNVLQSTWLAFNLVNESNVYTCVAHPLKADIENIIKWLVNDDFKTTYHNIKKLKTIKGLALTDIITEVHRYVHRIEFPYEVLVQLMDKMAQIEQRLASGTNENIQLTAFIAAFQNVKEITPPQDS